MRTPQVQALRRTVERQLADQCVVKRRQADDTWATVTTVNAWRAPNDSVPQESALAGEAIPPADRIVTLPALTDVKTGDRLEFTDTTYEALHVRGPLSDEVSRRVLCKEAPVIGENAVLLKVNAAGAIDGTGDAAAVGAELWSGSAPAHLDREVEQRTTGDETTPVEKDVLFVRRGYGVPFDQIVTGDQWHATTVLVEDRRTGTAVQRRFRVVRADYETSGTVSDGIRLELDDER